VDVEFELAQAEWALGQRARATGLATTARDEAARRGPMARKQVATVDAWLRTHR
jgi:hypothetical protein